MKLPSSNLVFIKIQAIKLYIKNLELMFDEIKEFWITILTFCSTLKRMQITSKSRLLVTFVGITLRKQHMIAY